MKKITELTHKRWRTFHYKDAYGNRIRDREEIVVRRPVKSIASGPRFGHFMVDLILFQIIYYLINYVFELIIYNQGLDPNVRITMFYLSLIISLLLYPSLYFLCEKLWQRTPGKFLTNSIVIDEYGNKPSTKDLIFRSLIRIVPFEPFTCMGDSSNGWHDRWANTWVVTQKELNELRRLQAEQAED